MNKTGVILHGEAMVFPSVVPTGAKRKKIKDKALIVANSKTTGNHHMVDVMDGVEIFEDEKGTLFMQNSVETQIRCAHAARHGTIKIPPGTYEFDTQQEYDPFTARMQKVRD